MEHAPLYLHHHHHHHLPRSRRFNHHHDLDDEHRKPRLQHLLYRSCRMRLHRSVCAGYGSNLGLRKKARKSLFSFARVPLMRFVMPRTNVRLNGSGAVLYKNIILYKKNFKKNKKIFQKTLDNPDALWYNVFRKKKGNKKNENLL